MTWLDEQDILVLDKVFSDREQMYLNRKNNLRQRLLGFYFSELKSVSLLCKNMDSIARGVSLHNQYRNTLKNLGLIDEAGKISANGARLLMIIYQDASFVRLIRSEEGCPIDKMEELYPRIPYQIELFLYAITAQNSTSDEGYTGRPYDIVINIKNLFNQIHDVLAAVKSSNRNNLKKDIAYYVDLDSPENIHLIQIMNYSGSEIRKFLTLPSDKKTQFWEVLKRALETCPSEASGLTEKESLYFEIIRPYTSGKLQKDVRHRAKYALYSHAIYHSLVIKKNRVSLERSSDEGLYDFIEYDTVRRIVEENQLKEIMYLVLGRTKETGFRETVKYYAIQDIERFNAQDNVLLDTEKNMTENEIYLNNKVVLVHEGDVVSSHSKRLESITPTSNFLEYEICFIDENPINVNAAKEALGD